MKALLIAAVILALLALERHRRSLLRIAAALESIAASARLLAGLTVDEVTRPVDRVGELTRRARMGRN